MMQLFTLGAISQIAKDFIVSFSVDEAKPLSFFVSPPDEVTKKLNDFGQLRFYKIIDFSLFGSKEFGLKYKILETNMSFNAT